MDFPSRWACEEITMAAKETTTAAEIEQEPSITATTTESGNPGLSGITSIMENEEQMALVRDYAPPVLAALGSFMAWGTIQAPIIGARNFSGVATDLGYIVIIGAAVAAYFTYKPHATRRLAGSALALLTTLGGYAYLQSIVSDMRAELAGNPFADTVSAGFGLGIHLTLVATVAMTYMAYKAYKAESDE